MRNLWAPMVTLLVIALAMQPFAQPDWSEVEEIFLQGDEVPEGRLLVGNATGIVYSSIKGDFPENKAVFIASASKWMCGAVAARMISEGVISIDGLVSTYMNTADTTLWTTDPDDVRSATTIEHLLSFTSPCFDETCDDSTLDKEECLWQYIYPNCEDVESGSRYHYGGAHMEIFASLAIKVTGLAAWKDVADKYLGEYIGVVNKGVSHQWGDSPPGSVFTTVENYEKFLRYIFLEDQALINEMEKDRLTSVSIASSPVTPLGQVWHYGFGNWLECKSSSWDPTCIDDQVFSSPGLFGFNPWIDRKNGYYAIVAQFDANLVGNRDPPPYLASVILGHRLSPAIIDVLSGEPSTSPSPSTTTPTPTPATSPTPTPTSSSSSAPTPTPTPTTTSTAPATAPSPTPTPTPVSSSDPVASFSSSPKPLLSALTVSVVMALPFFYQ